jgi:hypothetical protein
MLTPRRRRRLRLSQPYLEPARVPALSAVLDLRDRVPDGLRDHMPDGLRDRLAERGWLDDEADWDDDDLEADA